MNKLCKWLYHVWLQSWGYAQNHIIKCLMLKNATFWLWCESIGLTKKKITFPKDTDSIDPSCSNAMYLIWIWNLFCWIVNMPKLSYLAKVVVRLSTISQPCSIFSWNLLRFHEEFLANTSTRHYTLKQHISVVNPLLICKFFYIII